MRELIFCFFLFFAALSYAEESPHVPLWEYGFGAGFFQLEHYPASQKTRQIFLPFPTFQFRGDFLRADDREGARLYWVRGENWNLEVSGTGTPALDSGEDSAREGMKDLPWVVALGPQLVYQSRPEWSLGLGFFQAMSTDFQMTKTVGGLLELKATYEGESESGANLDFLKWVFNLKFSSRELQSLYYGVESQDVRAFRPLYKAKSGILALELGFFKSWKRDRVTYYWGLQGMDYSWAANQESPLHKVRQALNGLVGLTYALGESRQTRVP